MILRWEIACKEETNSEGETFPLEKVQVQLSPLDGSRELILLPWARASPQLLGRKYPPRNRQVDACGWEHRRSGVLGVGCLPVVFASGGLQ